MVIQGGLTPSYVIFSWQAIVLLFIQNSSSNNAIDALIGDSVTEIFTLATGDGITYSSDESVFNVVNGQAVVTRPDKEDATVTLTVRVVSDKVAGN